MMRGRRWTGKGGRGDPAETSLGHRKGRIACGGGSLVQILVEPGSHFFWLPCLFPLSDDEIVHSVCVLVSSLVPHVRHLHCVAVASPQNFCPRHLWTYLSQQG